MTVRRILLLFGLFFVLLGVAAARTTYFATVKGDTLKRAAATQQLDDSTVPARRGTIVDASFPPERLRAIAREEFEIELPPEPMVFEAAIDLMGR